MNYRVGQVFEFKCAALSDGDLNGKKPLIKIVGVSRDGFITYHNEFLTIDGVPFEKQLSIVTKEDFETVLYVLQGELVVCETAKNLLKYQEKKHA